MPTNLEKMIRLADEFFSTKNDPSQLDVTPEVIEQLQSIHSATLSEETRGDGPVCWILLIPSSESTMNAFLKKEISEKALLEEAQKTKDYNCIYLCSALVLPEFRKQGIAKRLTLDAIQRMQNDFKIKALYYWPFSPEGDSLANELSKLTGLTLFARENP